MQRFETSKLKRSPSFTKVYEAAKTLDPKNLPGADIANVNVKNGFAFDVITPGGMLEMDKGNEAAVDLLLKQGADVDYLAYGAVLGGNVERAEYYRKHFGADPNLIAKGAACVGNVSYAQYLHEQHGATALSITIGLILGHIHVNANDGLARLKATPNMTSDQLQNLKDDWQAVVTAIGISYGTAPEELNIPDSIKNDPKFNEWLAFGAGIAGRDIAFKDAEHRAWLERGMILGGHDEFFEQRIPDFEKNPYRYAAQGSHTSFDNKYASFAKEASKEDDYSDRFIGAHESNDIGSVKPYRDGTIKSTWYNGMYYNAKLQPRNLSLRMILCIYHSNSAGDFKLQDVSIAKLLPNAQYALHALAFNCSPELHKRLIDISNAKDEKLPYNIFNVVKDAQKIRAIMDKYQLNYDQAHALHTSADVRKLVLSICKDVNNQDNQFPLPLMIAQLKDCTNLSRADIKDLFQKIRHYRMDTVVVQSLIDDLDAYVKKADEISGLLKLGKPVDRDKVYGHSERVASLSKFLKDILPKPDNRGQAAAAIYRQNHALESAMQTEKEKQANQSYWSAASKVAGKVVKKTYGRLFNDVPKHEQPFDTCDPKDAFNTDILEKYSQRLGLGK